MISATSPGSFLEEGRTQGLAPEESASATTSQPRNMSPVAAYYLSQTDLARELGVSPDAVRLWRKRNPAGSERPFPEPDAWTGVDEVPEVGADGSVNPRANARSMPGWLPSRLGEVRAWRDSLPGQGARTDLG
jgi:hypothetical protein